MICPKCGGKIEKGATYCPHCGYPVTKTKKKSSGLLIAVILAEVAVIAAVVWFLFFRTTEEAPKDEPKAQAEATVKEDETEAETQKKEEETKAEPTEEPAKEEETEPEPTEEPEADPTETATPTPSPSPTATPTPSPTPTPANPEFITDADRIKKIRKHLSMLTTDRATATSSSTISQTTVSNPPSYILDDDPNTNWQEGVSGSGIGESVTVNMNQTYKVSALTFRLGNWKVKGTPEYYFYGNNRPRRLRIEANGYTWEQEFPDGRNEYALKFPTPIETDFLKYTILDVYSHQSWDDTPITDICVWYEGEGNSGGVQAAA